MQNVATTKELHAAFGRGDTQAILDRLAEDVNWDESDGPAAKVVPWLRPRRGRDEVGAFFDAPALHIARFEPKAYLSDDNHVVAIVTLDATLRSNGRRIHDDELHLWTFGPDGRVTAFRHYADTAKQMALVADS